MCYLSSRTNVRASSSPDRCRRWNYSRYSTRCFAASKRRLIFLKTAYLPVLEYIFINSIVCLAGQTHNDIQLVSRRKPLNISPRIISSRVQWQRRAVFSGIRFDPGAGFFPRPNRLVYHSVRHAVFVSPLVTPIRNSQQGECGIGEQDLSHMAHDNKETIIFGKMKLRLILKNYCAVLHCCPVV